MSKIICDVCGTVYPETATQCPICGCAKSADSRTVTGDKVSSEAAASYQFVKGGRFSKKNVNKRNQDNLVRQEKRSSHADEAVEEEEGVNKGLIVILLLLLAAIIAVVIYIAVRFFGPAVNEPGTKPPVNTDPAPSASTAAPTDPTEAPTAKPTAAPTEDDDHPCIGLTLQDAQIQLDGLGSTAQIVVNVNPSNTTDELLFTSDNDDVATVNDDGVVTAVGAGTARVTITCGSFQVHCDVEVIDSENEHVTDPTTEPTTEPTSEPTTEPTTAPTTVPTEAEEELDLNRSDITFFSAGESWYVYSGDLDVDDVIFSSDDESVAIFEDGVVTAVGPGVTTIYAEYGNDWVSCIIRCNWSVEEETTEPEEEPTEAPTEPEEEPTEPEEEPTEPEEEPTEDEDSDETYYISHSDVSIFVGESFYLTLTDSDGDEVDVTWYASQDGYVSISGDRIIGVSTINSSNFYVYTTVNGTAYYCIVRVR